MRKNGKSRGSENMLISEQIMRTNIGTIEDKNVVIIYIWCRRHLALGGQAQYPRWWQGDKQQESMSHEMK